MDRFDTLLFDTWAKWFGKKIHENRVPLISSLVVGFLSHMFAFTNKLVNHDEVYNLFAKGATLTSGRWGLGMMDSIFPQLFHALDLWCHNHHSHGRLGMLYRSYLSNP